MADKVLLSNLTLKGQQGSGDYAVQIALESDRATDVFVNSLIVGDTDDTAVILLKRGKDLEE